MGKKSSKKEKRKLMNYNSESSGDIKSSEDKNKYLFLFKNRWIVCALIFLISFLTYAPSLGNEFVWDDVITIEKKYYKFKTSKVASHIIPKEKKKRKASYYRPVIFASIVIDYKLWKDKPFGYHLTNNFLFSLSSVVFFLLVLLILKEFHIGSKEYIAAIAALVYIVHPMHVESVSWISGRSDVICTLFFLSAFVFHILSYKNFKFFPVVLLMLILSFLSKELAVSFPFLVLAYDLLKSKKIKLRNIYISLIYFSLMAIYLFLRGRSNLNIPGLSRQTIGISYGDSIELTHYLKSIAVMFNAYLFYFIKIVFPFKFNALITEVPKDTLYTVLSIVVISALSIWTFISIKFKTGLKAIGIIWILLTLGPSVLVAIFQVSTTPLAERYLFLPICGFSILVSFIIWPYFVKPKTNKIAVALFFSVCLLLLFFNVQRQSVWKDRVSLWDDISTKSESSAVAKVNRGMALIEEKKFDEGLLVLKSIFENKEKVPRAMKSIASNNIGIAYLNKKKPEIARKWFLKGVKYNPQFYKSYYHIALIDYSYARKLNSIKFYEKSEENARKAISINNRYGMAYYLLAKIYLAYYDTEQAKEYAQKALDLGLVKPLDEEAKKILEK